MHDPLLVIFTVLASVFFLLLLTFSLASVMIFLGAIINEKETELYDDGLYYAEDERDGEYR